VAFFALVHGGAHGGWCWEDLTPELDRLGHRSAAPDLPFEDPNGTSEWADAVIASIPPDAERVIVVGHSLGGLCLPVVASRRPVDRMVFLGAMVPVPGRSFFDWLAEEPTAIKASIDVEEALRGNAAASNDGPVMPFERARQMFYGDVDGATARRAWQRLRPQGATAFTEPCPIDTWPDVPSTYVLMTEDAAVDQTWSRGVAAGRLGAELVEIPGSHSPFYSRPVELAALLHRLAAE
jgi:pimeloyl-ACP methyl ester carboxylesterase